MYVTSRSVEIPTLLEYVDCMEQSICDEHHMGDKWFDCEYAHSHANGLEILEGFGFGSVQEIRHLLAHSRV
jgi:hypothetical protein